MTEGDSIGVASGDRRTQLSALRIPTLVIHGEADQIWATTYLATCGRPSSTTFTA